VSAAASAGLWPLRWSAGPLSARRRLCISVRIRRLRRSRDHRGIPKDLERRDPENPAAAMRTHPGKVRDMPMRRADPGLSFPGKAVPRRRARRRVN
jgi:DNA-binding GntR family transcriptional regulator